MRACVCAFVCVCVCVFAGLLLVSFSGYVNEVTLSWVNVFSIIVLVNSTGLGVFLVFGDARRVDTDPQDAHCVETDQQDAAAHV